MVLKNKMKNVIYQPTLTAHYLQIHLKRVMNHIRKEEDEGYQVFGLIEDKVYGVIEGPPNTIFEHGFFQFVMVLPEDYVFKPPKFFFRTKIFHPNIDEFGLVSVDILREQWSPAIYPFNKIIISVQSLLDDPNPNDFVNEKAAKLYKENIHEYEQTVRQYTSKYANFEAVQKELEKLNFKMELNN